ncbi:MAG: response regulator transcription factor [Planctomycetes bacterium]|nr:response regulator transcription factor [Planctomycetota bacterium]
MPILLPEDSARGLPYTRVGTLTVMLRDDHPDPLGGDQTPSDNPRLNLLLSYGGWREESCVDQLPRLLAPMGIQSIRVESGEEAEEVIRTYRVHIAVVDLAIPLRKTTNLETPSGATSTQGGARMLQLLRRLDEQPPTVVIRPPDPSLRESTRSLAQSLREGAFAVLDRPVAIEDMLEVMRRILRRYYADVWPT